jgi:hypothetical protein
MSHEKLKVKSGEEEQKKWIPRTSTAATKRQEGIAHVLCRVRPAGRVKGVRLGKDVGSAVHAPGLRRDDGARGQVVARELGATRGDDAREARGRGRVHAQRLLDDLVHVGQRLDVVVGEAVVQRGQLGQEAGLDVRVPAYQPDEIR